MNVRKWVTMGGFVVAVIAGLITTVYAGEVGGDFISTGSNSWILHTPDDGRTSLYIAPGTNGGNWNWSAQTLFFNNGNVYHPGSLGVGISSPRSKLDVWGGQLLITGSNYNGTAYITSSSGTAWFSNNSLTNGIAINPSGNIGIGTGAPAALLHVGDIYGAGGRNLEIGDDTYLSDVDEAGTLGIYGLTSADVTLKMGVGGSKVKGYANGDMCLGKGC